MIPILNEGIRQEYTYSADGVSPISQTDIDAMHSQIATLNASIESMLVEKPALEIFIATSKSFLNGCVKLQVGAGKGDLLTDQSTMGFYGCQGKNITAIDYNERVILLNGKIARLAKVNIDLPLAKNEVAALSARYEKALEAFRLQQIEAQKIQSESEAKTQELKTQAEIDSEKQAQQAQISAEALAAANKAKMKKYLIFGGIALLILVGGFLLFKPAAKPKLIKP
jgi:hypothetical protein